ncbi:hypothetical protein TIFTF001_005542 [Ficus carica]|uniref:Uncharacterized protein n=1 Tax=Ficus carica TaxID=3494 RepID=A0AA87ZM74_FICCA|nr:hypothetical protein TIFTF001_005542 [Ficus carica]
MCLVLDTPAAVTPNRTEWRLPGHQYLALRERLELARTYRMRVNLVETDAMNFVTPIRPGSIGDDAFILRNVKSLVSCMGGVSCSCSPLVFAVDFLGLDV